MLFVQRGYTALVLDAATWEDNYDKEDSDYWKITELLIDGGANLDSFEIEVC